MNWAAAVVPSLMISSNPHPGWGDKLVEKGKSWGEVSQFYEAQSMYSESLEFW